MPNINKYKQVIKWWDKLMSTACPIPLLVPPKVNKPEFVKEAERLVVSAYITGSEILKLQKNMGTVILTKQPGD